LKSTLSGALSLPLFLVVLLGCDGRELECGELGQNANVSGDWVLIAEGERTDCSKADYEAEAELKTMVVLEVEQESTGPNGADILRLREPITLDGVTFTFSGSVHGGCVEFTTTEKGPDYQLGFTFEGNIESRNISGDFREITAGVCRTEGSFEVTISPRPRPPGPDAGFRPDASQPGEDAGPDLDASTEAPAAGEPLAAGSEVDAGETDAGRPRVDAGPVRPYECYRNEECEVGYCIDRYCVSMCETNQECEVGDSCISGRCEPAPGCGCVAATGSGTLLIALGVLLTLARKRRASP